MAVTGALAHPNIVTTFKCHIRQLPATSPSGPPAPSSSSSAAAHRNIPPSAGNGKGSRIADARGDSRGGGGEGGRFGGGMLPSPDGTSAGECSGVACFPPLGQGGLLGTQDGGPEWMALGDAGRISKTQSQQSQSQQHQQQGMPCELRIIMELCECK